MFRKKKNEKLAEPMPKKQFQRICRALRKHGVMVLLGDEIDKLCAVQSVEAITFNSSTVAFSSRPSRSVVFEELIHLSQYSHGRCDGSKLSRIKCEIEAKEKVLGNANAYRLTKSDIELTKGVLEQDYADLHDYYRGGV